MIYQPLKIRFKMKEEQLLKMAEQVKKTCEENGITVLMLIR